MKVNTRSFAGYYIAAGESAQKTPQDFAFYEFGAMD
jgi:hypothetical protein